LSDSETVSPAEKRPFYLPTPGQFLSVAASIFCGIPKRSLARDAIRLLDSHQPRPYLFGVENLPRNEPFVVVANHHHRANQWIGWVGALLIEAIHSFRPVEVPIRIVVTDAQRVRFQGRSRKIPFSGWFLGRIAKLWGMIPLSGDPADTASRAATLKRALNVLRNGEPVLLFPEGDRGTAYGLVEALPGTGGFLALAARHAKIVPVAFWEEGEQLSGCVDAPMVLTSRDDVQIRQQAMFAIGRMLPRSMWGVYSAAISMNKRELL
jgi:hypothetical protein